MKKGRTGAITYIWHVWGGVAQKTVLSVVFMLLLSCPAKAEGALNVCVYTVSPDGQEKEENLENFRQGDYYRLNLDETGCICFSLQNRVKGQPYRVRLSGIAENGEKFEWNDIFDEVWGRTGMLNFAGNPGTYGPHQLEIIGNGEVLTYQVELVMDCQYDITYGTAIGETGFVTTPRFAAASTSDGSDYSLSITSPADGSTVMGNPGERFMVFRHYHQFNGVATIELSDLQTGEILASEQDDMSYNEEGADSGLGTELELSENLEPGRKYELVLSDGKKEDRATFTFEDTSLLQKPLGEGKEIQVFAYNAQYEETKIEDLKQDDSYMAYVNGGFLAFAFEIGEYAPYRARLFGTAQNGQPFEYKYQGVGDSNMGGMYFTKTPGTYGPYTLEVECGGQTRQYSIEVVVPDGMDQGEEEEEERPVQGGTDEWEALDIPGGTKIASPENGTRLYGKSGYKLPIMLSFCGETGAASVEIADPENGEIVCSHDFTIDETAAKYGYADYLSVPEFESGKEYDIRVKKGESTDTVRVLLLEEPEEGEKISEQTLNLKVKDPILVPEGAGVYSAEIALTVQSSLNGMETVEADDDRDFMQYRFGKEGQAGRLLESFSVYCPNVSRDEVEFNMRDLGSAADWMIYEEYSFQVDDMSDYTDMAPIHMETLDQLFGAGWLSLDSFDFAQGFCETEDGTAYNWLPVYYQDASGHIYNNEVYLFVYMICPGADEDYLSQRAYYPVYEDYRTEKLLITDQSVVREILSRMISEGNMFQIAEDTNTYETLTEESTGDAVRAIQAALVDKGYMTSSVDGYYGPMTTEAVSAYQEAMGLEPTGTADADLQRMLLSQTEDKERLLGWMASQGA